MHWPVCVPTLAQACDWKFPEITDHETLEHHWSASGFQRCFSIAAFLQELSSDLRVTDVNRVKSIQDTHPAAASCSTWQSPSAQILCWPSGKGATGESSQSCLSREMTSGSLLRCNSLLEVEAHACISTGCKGSRHNLESSTAAKYLWCRTVQCSAGLHGVG